jgi:hypothetical protein
VTESGGALRSKQQTKAKNPYKFFPPIFSNTTFHAITTTHKKSWILSFNAFDHYINSNSARFVQRQ